MLAIRLAALESRQQFRAYQQAIEHAFAEAADDAGLPACARTAILGALQAWHGQYPHPPTGWHLDYDAAYVVADAHIRAARAIVGAALPDRPTLAAVLQGMRARLLAYRPGVWL
jgi:hypothetical protein